MSSISIWRYLFCLMAMLPLSAWAALEKVDINGVWTGLQRDATTLYRFTLVVDETARDGNSDQGNATAPRSRSLNWLDPSKVGNAMQFGLGERISGQITLEQANVNAMAMVSPTQTFTFQGEVIPELNMLKIQYTVPRRGELLVFGVLSEDKKRMAIVYGGSSRDTLPIVLHAGNELPAAMAALVSPKSKADQVRNNAEAFEQPREDTQAQIQVLQQQIDQAHRARDMQTVARLGEKMNVLMQAQIEQQAKVAQTAMQQIREQRAQRLQEAGYASEAELDAQMNLLQKQIVQALQVGDFTKVEKLQAEVQQLNDVRMRVMTDAPIPVRADNQATCPGAVLKWAEELEINGASMADFSGLVPLTNLFRPSVFRRHFGADLLALPPTERRQLGSVLEGSCTSLDNAFARGSNIVTVARGFGEQALDLDYIGAAMSGEALDMLAQWTHRAVSELGERDSVENIDRFVVQSTYLLDALWPNEKSVTNAAVETAVSQIIKRSLLNAMEAEQRRVSSTGLAAMEALGRLKYAPQWNRLNAKDKANVEAQYGKVVEASLTSYLADSFPPQSDATTRPLDALVAGQRWYQQHNLMLPLFASSAALQSFEAKFLAQREAHYSVLKSTLEADIAALSSIEAANLFGSEFAIPLDSRGCKTWQQLETRIQNRILELNRTALIARVGEGPFTVDDPGAIYLNALYRNDWETIKEEDRNFSQAIIDMMAPVTNSGVYDLMAVYSGNKVSAGSIKAKLQEKMQSATMSTNLLGFYIVALDYVTPQCLGDNPVQFERTVSWDEVVENGLGMELSRTRHSQTQHYRIARRHADIFQSMGPARDAEHIDLVNSLLGGTGMIPPHARAALNNLSANLKGLRMAMQKHPCDGPVMRQLEQALIAKADH